MNLILFIVCMIFTSVVAPPPLEVELKAEREYRKQLLELKDISGDVIPNLSVDDRYEVVEDMESDDPILMKKDESDEFVPLTMPNNFDKYDLNDDDFIDEGELVSIIGILENNNLALKAADSNGDGMLSRDEFENGPWDLDIADVDLSDETMDDIEGEDEMEEFIDYDDDKFDDLINDQISNDSFEKEMDNKSTEKDVEVDVPVDVTGVEVDVPVDVTDGHNEIKKKLTIDDN